MRKPFITVRLTHGMLGALLVSTCACSGTKWTEVEKDSIRIVTQQEGAVLGYSANSGVRLLTVDGYAFKDLNRNGRLDPYEDWRLTPEERAVDLAGQLSTEEIAGLMLYSAHQSIPGASKGFGTSTYNCVFINNRERKYKFKTVGSLKDALSEVNFGEALSEDYLNRVLEVDNDYYLSSN